MTLPLIVFNMFEFPQKPEKKEGKSEERAGETGGTRMKKRKKEYKTSGKDDIMELQSQPYQQHGDLVL
jgi:hypothetical protein